MKNKLVFAILITLIGSFTSCGKFLDVIPDNVATIDNAFSRRAEAEKYLFTCFSYMMRDGDIADDPAILAGDELWRFSTIKGFMEVARGYQNTTDPYGDRWSHFYKGIRVCNTFLENISSVPDIDELERSKWISEVKFLKAYYHFSLMRMYGPIPVIRENAPIDIGVGEGNAFREPIDTVVNYIVDLVDQSVELLPLTIENPGQEMGRITKPIALSFKAQVLTYAASPLFNGNTDMANFKNSDGTLLFSPEKSIEKWKIAADACKEAILTCREAGIGALYKYPGSFQYNLSDTIKTQLSIRNVVTENWNNEIIWANTQTNSSSFQILITPFIDPSNLDISIIRGELSPTMKMAELFYTKNGVPITEDKTWDFNNRKSLKSAQKQDQLYIKTGYITAQLNFDREPRFYANLGFDGGIWYGQGKYDDKKPADLFYLEAKFRQRNGFGKAGYGTVTGYYLKKKIHYENVIGIGNNYSVISYPFTIMRLADLYLLYAECLNEFEGPGEEIYQYLDLVRERAGLKSIKDSWENYSTNPTKFQTQSGLREIIQTERLIELAFEGKRYWDLKRWKKSTTELNKPIIGWDLSQANAVDYYRAQVIFNQHFYMKDYFWPISETTLSRNKNLVQNLGW